MGLFGLLNYEDYILNTVVKSSYARNGLVVLLLYLITAMVRFHLAILICILFTWNNIFDLIFPVIVTVLLSMASDTLFKYVETHRPTYEQLVDYFIANYSRENFIRWKRFLLIGICCYVLLAITLIQVDNYFIFLSTVQTAASFGICDLLENKMPQNWYNRLMDWWHRPRITRSGEKRDIIDNYFPMMKNLTLGSRYKSGQRDQQPIHNSSLRNNRKLVKQVQQPHQRHQVHQPVFHQIEHSHQLINENLNTVYDRGPKSNNDSEKELNQTLDFGVKSTQTEIIDMKHSKDTSLTLRRNSLRRSLDSALPRISSETNFSNMPSLSASKDKPLEGIIAPKPAAPISPLLINNDSNNLIPIGIRRDSDLYIERVSPIPIKPPTPPMISQAVYTN